MYCIENTKMVVIKGLYSESESRIFFWSWMSKQEATRKLSRNVFQAYITYTNTTHTLLHKIHEVLGSKLLACILGLPDYPEGILIFNLVCMRWALYTRGIVWCSKSFGHVSKTHTHMHNLESNVKTEENY